MYEFELNGQKFVATLESDCDAGAPWEESEGHGIVTDWTTRDKKPGELILAQDRRGARRYYDFSESCRIALRDGWDSPPYNTGTARQRASRAAMADYNYLRQWCAGDWEYVTVTVRRADSCECCGDSRSCGGVESLGDYWREVARDLAGEF